MKSQEYLLRRREQAEKLGAEELARALERTLVLLRYKGKCRCGLMLTERDQNSSAETYSCPHCGRSGLLMSPA